jgi:hypothetical protein
MAIEDLTPFGTAPKFYQGLLGEEETAALQKKAQIQGLLGAGLALAKGMSSYGPPRSALQNILGAVAGGFEGAGGTYQQGLQNFQTQQQIQQLKLQRDQQLAQADAVKQLLLDPTIASDPAAVAYIRANPVEAVKEISQRRMREGELAKLRQGRAGATTQTGSMTAEIDAQIQSLRDNASIAASQGKSDQASQFITAANNLNKEKQNIAAANFDFAGLKESVPESLRSNVDFLAKQARDGVIGGDKVFEGIQKIQEAAIEAAKGNKFSNEMAKDFSRTYFKTDDITKLEDWQKDLTIRFVNAPSPAEQAKIKIEAEKLLFETGVNVPPVGSRTDLIPSANRPRTQVAPVTTTTPVTTPVTTAPAPVVSQPPAAPRVPAAQTTPVTTREVIPMVEKPDNIVPVQQKQKLVQSQPATIALANYSLDNISQQKKAAEELLNNPQYIKALTSKGLLGGYATEKLANNPGNPTYDANQLLKNLQTRSFVSEIQKMRNASPTGGAVGSVSEKEMEGLSNIGAALKLGMSEKELTKQLRMYVNNADRALKTIPNEYSRTYRYQGEFDQYLNPNQNPAGVTVERIR